MRGSIEPRLASAEEQVQLQTKEPLRVETFYVEGNEPGVDAADFLRSQGHDIGPEIFAIIPTIIPAKDGKALEAPFVDVTHEMRKRTERN